MRRVWATELAGIDLATPDAKSVLQERAQGRRLPTCRSISKSRAKGRIDAPRFTAEVQIDGVAPERGQGATSARPSKPRDAERGVWQAPQDG